MRTVSPLVFGNDPAGLKRFLEGYGTDPRDQPSFKRLCEIYELHTVIWSLGCAAGSQAMTEEASIRVAGLLGRSQMARIRRPSASSPPLYS